MNDEQNTETTLVRGPPVTHVEADAESADGNSPSAETRSAPGDLSNGPATLHKRLQHLANERPGTSHEVERREDASGSKAPFSAVNGYTTMQQNNTKGASSDSQQQDNVQPTSGQRSRGHLRGTRSNGFCSGPPFAKRPRTRDARHWGSTIDERQKQQQIELIEKEINVMAKESQCGIGKWRPEWLQRFATKNWMLLLLCWFCTIQGMLVNGLIPSSISTIERRFQLSTSTIGRIMQFYDFGYVLFCIPVSYFGGRHSKSTVLSLGLLLMSCGSFLFTTPHMIAEPYTNTYDASSAGISKCYGGGNHSSGLPMAEFDAMTSCPSPENQPGTFRYVFLFCLAHFLHGIGATPLFTIGVSYIDENVCHLLKTDFIDCFLC